LATEIAKPSLVVLLAVSTAWGKLGIHPLQELLFSSIYRPLCPAPLSNCLARGYPSCCVRLFRDTVQLVAQCNLCSPALRRGVCASALLSSPPFLLFVYICPSPIICPAFWPR
jgi:hypothetical protein